MLIDLRHKQFTSKLLKRYICVWTGANYTQSTECESIFEYWYIVRFTEHAVFLEIIYRSHVQGAKFYLQTK